LKQLWRQFHEKLREVSCALDPVVELLERAAYAMLDDSYVDVDPWVRNAAAAFREEFAARPEDHRLSWDLGVTFYNTLGEVAAIPSLRVLESVAIPYRDDNRYIWAFDEAEWREAEYVPASQRQVRKTVNIMEMVNELDCELAGDDAQEIWRLETPFYLDQEDCTINELEGTEPVSEPYHYPEWDYQVQLHRPDWVTVLEKRQAKGDPGLIDATLVEYRPVASRLKHIIDALQPQGLIRQRRQEDGDEIDINAAIRAMVDLRMGQTPDTRINIRHIRKTRDLAVLVLLDLSESTNETLAGTDRPVLQLAREATTLLAWALNGIGDPLAIHGFASDGRHDLQYYRFKDFDQDYDDAVKARLAGMHGGLSTRMGGALRHAAGFLMRQPQQKKLILLVSDGEPADIDVRDPQYLRQDTKKAVEELNSRGVITYCLTLDPQADDYVARIFGANHYTVVDHVQRLPERLPALFMGLTK
jgi:nitric oxide reductase NorD protein